MYKAIPNQRSPTPSTPAIKAFILLSLIKAPAANATIATDHHGKKIKAMWLKNATTIILNINFITNYLFLTHWFIPDPLDLKFV